MRNLVHQVMLLFLIRKNDERWQQGYDYVQNKSELMSENIMDV
jgi:hypothetical protein